MIAMRYGLVPVVRRTGGLKETVSEGPNGTGFCFEGLAAEDLLGAVTRAAVLRRGDPIGWRALQRRGMVVDFSIDQMAADYAALYEREAA